MPPDSPTVSVEHLVVERGHRTVLLDVSTSIPAGAVTGLLGPSGSGKTTLMRSIVGTQKVKSGTVTVLGEPAGSKPLRRRVAYVTQDASIYPDLSVKSNVSYFAALCGRSKEDAMAAIDAVGMHDHANQLAGNLSGGQKTRTSLACALVCEPEVLVLDEPTVGLDPVIREELWNHFHDLAAAGKTVLVSSHVMDEADRCDRLLLLREGRFIADDTPGDLRASTGTDNLESAFLHLIRELEKAG
ncbi:ABC transporter ATP-binding protein [Glycomyces sp. L485]|uniref:ABC transporter ATP-binding protein n=1 Tax=Glycomyces sp. L485 TaxID=2909235 RepID=UPI001F4B295A|nr:ABC transporter ATP-binding protein [Glycomyces sp. L485]MCH7231008.1 ABC transporter ATP-binding protein [Glycomyces sp. L485]